MKRSTKYAVALWAITVLVVGAIEASTSVKAKEILDTVFHGTMGFLFALIIVGILVSTWMCRRYRQRSR